MIKALSVMELFQIIKRYIRESGLNFQKYYERDQNRRAGGREPYNGVGGRGSDESTIYAYQFNRATNVQVGIICKIVCFGIFYCT